MREIPVLTPTTREELITLITSDEGYRTQTKMLENSQIILDLVGKINQMIDMDQITGRNDHMSILKVHSDLVSYQSQYLAQIGLLRLAYSLLV